MPQITKQKQIIMTVSTISRTGKIDIPDILDSSLMLRRIVTNGVRFLNKRFSLIMTYLIFLLKL